MKIGQQCKGSNINDARMILFHHEYVDTKKIKRENHRCEQYPKRGL